MFTRTVMAGLILGFAALAPPKVAHAQAACNTRDTVVDRLGDKYQETIAARGLQSSQQMLEIFASPETGSFTILLSRPDGTTCVVASGTHWHLAAPVDDKGVAS